MEATAEREVTTWAAMFALADANAAARLRLRPGVVAAVVDDALWLRGDRWGTGLERLLDHAAPLAIYRLDGTRLTPIGHLLATNDLPNADWRPLAELLPIDVPPALSPAAVKRMPLRLMRSGVEKPAAALLTDFDAFAAWCDTAPAIRLKPLRIALQRPRVLVIGTPLPPLAGVALYEAAGILVPCGYALSPAVDAASLRVLLSLSSGDLALFDDTGWCRVPADAVANVSRSAIRMTRLEAGA